MESWFRTQSELYRKFSINLGKTSRPQGFSPLYFPKDFAGLANILSSFAAANPQRLRPREYGIVEWNPLNQRLLVYSTPTEIQNSDFEHHFENVSPLIHDFIATCHEAIHILLLEPFFAGNLQIRSASEWSRLSLCLEGFTTWYSEIIMTPRMREKLPDGEFVYDRSAISSINYHPFRALRAIGVKSPQDALDVYLHSFQDRERPMVDSGDLFANDLSVRFFNFYKKNLNPSRHLFKALKELGIFDEFKRRFCSAPGLPSLLPNDMLQAISMTDPEGYCHEMYRRGLRHIHGLTRDHIARVRLRRALQGRAYFALTLRKTLEEGRHFSRREALDLGHLTKRLLESVQEYLDGLEELTRMFSQRKQFSEISRALTRLDASFDRRFTRPTRRADLWLGRRRLIFPEIPKMGVYELGAPLSAEDFRGRRVNHVLDFVSQLLLQHPSGTEGIADVHLQLGQLLRDLALFRRRPDRSRARKLATQYRRILHHPLVLTQWSAPLGSIAPAENSFRELLFTYL